MRPILSTVCAVAGILLQTFPGQTWAASSPANPQATAKARSMLAYLAGLPDRADKRVVSGQFTDFGFGSNLSLLDAAKLATGHYPGLMGGDYADFSRSFVSTRTVGKAASEYWNAGGMVSISAHVPHPGGGGLRDRDVDLAQLLVPGTPTNVNWMRTLDSMAAGLQTLRNVGVVVLWRPFHEMNGDWFWWNGKDSAAFVRTWRHMFDYYSKEKGLDNLLWVYSPNMGSKVTTYYPGDAYVDITGLDAYTDNVDAGSIKGYAELIRLGKPFGLTEYGPHGASNPPGDFDYRRLLAGIKKDFPKTCFFMCWNAKWSLAQNRFAREMLNDPWIVNREDLGLANPIRPRIARAGPQPDPEWRICLGGARAGCALSISAAEAGLPWRPGAGSGYLDVTGKTFPIP
jgi:mannan endo-1,4-beta-mannosidase